MLNKYSFYNIKKLYTRYSIATKYIPASNILNNLLNEINHYIAILAHFVNDPSSADLR